MQILNELLDNIVVGPPQVFEDVQVFPLLGSQTEPSVPFLELDDALAQGSVEITEESEGGNEENTTYRHQPGNSYQRSGPGARGLSFVSTHHKITFMKLRKKSEERNQNWLTFQPAA